VSVGRAGPAAGPAHVGSVGAWIERGLSLLSGVAAVLGAVALAGLFVVVLVAVVMRYAWGRPYAGSEELAGLLMTVAVFALLPVTLLHEQHIRVSVVADRLVGWRRRATFLLGQAVLLAFIGAFLWQAWAIAAFTAQLKLLAEQSQLPLAPFLYVSLFAMGLAGLVAAWRTVAPRAPTGHAP